MWDEQLWGERLSCGGILRISRDEANRLGVMMTPERSWHEIRILAYQLEESALCGRPPTGAARARVVVPSETDGIEFEMGGAGRDVSEEHHA